MSEEQKNYTPVADGYHNGVHPAFVDIIDDYFNEGSTQVKVAFFVEDGFEQPVAKISLYQAPGHEITEWKDGEKTSRPATAKDQDEAFAFLGRIFPRWSDFCKGSHTNEEKMQWFRDHSDDAKLETMDIKVRHSDTGFPNAYVMDPAKSKKPAKRRTVSSSDAARAAASLGRVFGAAQAPEGAGAAEDLPF